MIPQVLNDLTFAAIGALAWHFGMRAGDFIVASKRGAGPTPQRHWHQVRYRWDEAERYPTGDVRWMLVEDQKDLYDPSMTRSVQVGPNDTLHRPLQPIQKHKPTPVSPSERIRVARP